LGVEEAAEVVLDGEVQLVDLVVDDQGDIAVNNVHLGVGAEGSRRGAIWKHRLGRLGYGLGMLHDSFIPSFRLEVDIDGERVADRGRPVLEVSVGNPDVMRRSCDSVTVTGEPFQVSADGEIYGPVPRRAWRLERGVLRLLLAKQRPGSSGSSTASAR
jgi:diacylglycerol kinase family enzyme